MIVNKRVFVDGAENISTRDVIADLEVSWLEIPLQGAVNGLGVNTTRNVN
jgi:hypothetical protein